MLLLPTPLREPASLSQLSAALQAALPLNFHNTPSSIVNQLFPWVLDWPSLQHHVHGTMGIVIPVGDKYTRLAAHAIKVLRWWNCTLPIQVTYMGPSDLAHAAVAYFNSQPNVSTLDLSQRLDNTKLGLQKWAIKPFSILYSSFEKVLLMDADVVWLQDPLQVLQDKGFITTGALFFPDRMMKQSKRDHAAWLASFIPPPLSPSLTASSMYRGLSDHLQESGVVVLDKSRGLDGLLASCLLNDPRVRLDVRNMTFGEKETFWLGYELARQSYSFHPGAVGSIGAAMYSQDQDEYLLCGHLAHFDLSGDIMWFNDGLVTNKHIMDMSLAPFTHSIRHGEWHDICMKGGIVSTLSPPQATAMQAINALWQRLDRL